MKKKIAYISIANAIAIIAVIIGHLDITGTNNDPRTPIANMITAFGSFQMPLFMCISGFLFSMTSGFNKSYTDLVKSKMVRLLIPFLFLSLFTFCFKMCLPSSMLEHGVGLNSTYLYKMFFIPFRGPVPHLWFVVSLFTIFLISPIYKWSVKKTGYTIMVLGLLYVIHLIPSVISWFTNKEFLALDKTQYFIFWFYLGIVMQKYALVDKLNNWPTVVASGISYTLLVYWISFPLSADVCLLLGVIFVLSLSYKLSSVFENLFASWRNYTYQIYLMHMFPIMGGVNTCIKRI